MPPFQHRCGRQPLARFAACAGPRRQFLRPLPLRFRPPPAKSATPGPTTRSAACRRLRLLRPRVHRYRPLPSPPPGTPAPVPLPKATARSAACSTACRRGRVCQLPTKLPPPPVPAAPACTAACPRRPLHRHRDQIQGRLPPPPSSANYFPRPEISLQQFLWVLKYFAELVSLRTQHFRTSIAPQLLFPPPNCLPPRIEFH